LNQPVSHLRDVRTELVVKIMLRQRAGLDIKRFIDAQRDAFASVLSVIEATRPTTPVDMWRAESASAVKRYLTRVQKAAD
jgi:hypothetical protein